MRREGGAFTQRDQAPVVFQHHTPVQTPLSRVQPRPLFRGELYSHIPKCHQALQRQNHILAGPVLRPCPPNAHVEALTPCTQKVNVFGDGAFKKVTKSSMKSHGWALIRSDWYSCKRRKKSGMGERRGRTM